MLVRCHIFFYYGKLIIGFCFLSLVEPPLGGLDGETRKFSSEGKFLDYRGSMGGHMRQDQGVAGYLVLQNIPNSRLLMLSFSLYIVVGSAHFPFLT